jgi:hypothetical protein
MVLAVLSLCLGARGVRAEDLKFYGYAYDLKSGKYLYTEVYHEVAENGRWVSGTTRYYAPDGRLLGDKTLNFTSDPYIPLYTMKLFDEDYIEGILKVDMHGIDLFKVRRGQRKEKVVDKDGLVAADAGFHPLIIAHFDSLAAGAPLKFTFAAAGLQNTFRFVAKKSGDTEFEGRPAVQFRLEPDSVLRLFNDPLLLTYDPDDKRLLEFRGISNVHDPSTGKAYNARIEYYSKPPDDAPRNLPPLE